MDNKETPYDQILIFDTSSINNLTGNEIYFYSNYDASTYNEGNLCQLHEEHINDSSSTSPILDIKNENDKNKKIILNQNRDEGEVKRNKLCKLMRKSQGHVNNYFISENTNKQYTYEEREKFVFEHEFEKVNNVYNVEEIMKIINNLNSIRKEIETAIYKKMEKKYKDFIFNTSKIKDIENYISNIKDLLVENINELKMLQDKKYKESLNIIDLVTKKKKSQKINLIILIIYIISIYDKLIFKNILKRDYEYATVIYYELFSFINNNVTLLHNIKCICNLKEKMFSEYFNRLKQKNQANFVEFLFADNSKKNLETQLEKSFKIYYLLFKSKPFNFIENLLAYVYQCFQKISKQVIFSFVIVSERRDREQEMETKKKREKSEQREEKREPLKEEHIEEVKYSQKGEKQTEESLFLPNDNRIIIENNEYIQTLLPHKNADLNKHVVDYTGNMKITDTEQHHMENLESPLFSTKVSINDMLINTYENSYDLNKEKKKDKTSLSDTNKTTGTYENRENQLQEDNFLFIPLNELVQKLKEKDSLISLLKIYEIVIDILNKYNFIIIYLLNCHKNYVLKFLSKEDAKESRQHKQKKKKDFLIDHVNELCVDRNNKKKFQQKSMHIDKNKCKGTGKMEGNNPEGKKAEEVHSEDKKSEGGLLEDKTINDDHDDNLSLQKLFDICKNKKDRSIFSKFYEIKECYDLPIITYFMKNLNEENFTSSENCLNIKEKVETYLRDKSSKYEQCEEYIKFARGNAKKLINAKSKFIKNIEKVIKTIIEHIRFENFSFNDLFTYIVITIMFCVNSFLFENNCSNNLIYNLTKDELRREEPKGKDDNERCEQFEEEKIANMEDKKYVNDKENKNLNDKLDIRHGLHVNQEEEKLLEVEAEYPMMVQRRKKGKAHPRVNLNFNEKVKKESATKLIVHNGVNPGGVINNNVINGGKSEERLHINSYVTNKERDDKCQQQNDKHKLNVEDICKEYFLKKYKEVKTFGKEEKIHYFQNLLKNNIIYEEIERKVKNNFSNFFYQNSKKLNDIINKDSWSRVPVKINHCLFKKRLHFFNIISFYKKEFNAYLNIPFSQNPLINFNFKKLEEELYSDKDLSEPEDLHMSSYLGKKKKIKKSNFTPITLIASCDMKEMEKNTYNHCDSEICKKSNVNKTKNKVYRFENFEIVNFDLVVSNSSIMLTSILHNYFTIKELLPNIKEEINDYIFKIIDIYIYILCFYFLKRETIEELVIDLRRCSSRLGINKTFFIIKKREKYMQLYNFLIFYNKEIIKYSDKYHFLYVDKSLPNSSQTKYNVGNFNNNLKDKNNPHFLLRNFHKIYSSVSLNGLSEKIISVESLYSLIWKLKENVINTGDVSKMEEENEKNDTIKHRQIKNTVNSKAYIKQQSGISTKTCSGKQGNEEDIFLMFLDQKLRIVDELRILTYCDSLYEIIDSNNYINEISNLINVAYGNKKDKTELILDDDSNIKKNDLRKNLNQYIDLYINILNDAKRKLLFCCESVASIVIHYLLWNLINYIFNLNNIEIIHKIESAIMPIITCKNKKQKNYATYISEKVHKNLVTNSCHVGTMGKEIKEISQKKANNNLVQPNSISKGLRTNLVSNDKVISNEMNSYDGENDDDDTSSYLINTLKFYFSKISNLIIQNIINLENEIEQYEKNNNNIQNTIYMSFYKDLKNCNSKRYEFYYIFLSKGTTYYDQYLDLHFCNVEELDRLIKSSNYDFFQFKHIHSIILKYEHFKMVPNRYADRYEIDICRSMDGKIKSRLVSGE
ncbi:hypothetical protein MKS88_000411 [Plasmodium brasilianum]|uniref:Uncharacterized protein n=2 Tax=Plasmodium (Plasmodium) TaxID=418103 RepID=A0A1D3JKC1_PLAMA|nr:conserved Plasmodium protein, unknown function [Plasmodium malariae]KAI4841176.1 hypothetical protein MKS88_000411 [Plasmodium brasilianum]SBT86856.1 conserved Plasmodium protein, unknown function [Plasmodium malariae]